MNLIQAILIALLGYLGAKWSISPMGDMGGYWTIGRPLVAGALIGAILGDVQQGVILGCAINALFIGTVNVGGVTANDINFGTFIGIPLAMVAKASVEEACVLAALLGQLGLFIWNFTKIINVTWIRVIDKKLEAGDVPLDDAINEFNKAMNLAKICDAKLKNAEEAITKLVKDNGEVVDFQIEE